MHVHSAWRLGEKEADSFIPAHRKNHSKLSTHTRTQSSCSTKGTQGQFGNDIRAETLLMQRTDFLPRGAAELLLPGFLSSWEARRVLLWSTRFVLKQIILIRF